MPNVVCANKVLNYEMRNANISLHVDKLFPPPYICHPLGLTDFFPFVGLLLFQILRNILNNWDIVQ
jgi:hypothetical protein